MKEREEKQKDSFWHSKLSSFLSCPQKYVYEYVEGLRSEQEKEPLIFGNAIHLGLEALLTGEDGIAVFEYFWNSIKPDTVEWARYGHEYLADMGPKMLSNYEKRHLPYVEPILVEKRLFGQIEDDSFEGTPDLYCKDRGVLSLTDFKTSGYRYEKGKIECATQLIDYATLLVQNGYEAPQQVIYKVFQKSTGGIQTLKKTLTEADFVASEARLKETIGLVKGAKEFPKNSGSCFYGSSKCAWFEKCWGQEGK